MCSGVQVWRGRRTERQVVPRREGVTLSGDMKVTANDLWPKGVSAVERQPSAIGMPPSCFEYGTQSPCERTRRGGEGGGNQVS